MPLQAVQKATACFDRATLTVMGHHFPEKWLQDYSVTVEQAESIYLLTLRYGAQLLLEEADQAGWYAYEVAFLDTLLMELDRHGELSFETIVYGTPHRQDKKSRYLRECYWVKYFILIKSLIFYGNCQ